MNVSRNHSTISIWKGRQAGKTRASMANEKPRCEEHEQGCAGHCDGGVAAECQ